MRRLNYRLTEYRSLGSQSSGSESSSGCPGRRDIAPRAMAMSVVVGSSSSTSSQVYSTGNGYAIRTCIGRRRQVHKHAGRHELDEECGRRWELQKMDR
jgi:hypothetical protein